MNRHPRFREISESREKLDFKLIDTRSPALERFLKQFEPMYKFGAAVARTFEIANIDHAAQWFFSRKRFEEYGLASSLIASQGFAEALPDIGTGVIQGSLVFRAISPFLLDGLLAEVLAAGGVEPFAGTGAEAKSLALAAAHDLISDEYSDRRVFHSTSGWSDWHYFIGFDATFVIVDTRRCLVTAICLTEDIG